MAETPAEQKFDYKGMQKNRTVEHPKRAGWKVRRTKRGIVIMPPRPEESEQSTPTG